MSIKLDKKEIEKVNIYLDMIRQYNIEMQSVIQNDEQIQKLIQENQDFQKLDFTIQKTNESLRTFIGSVVANRNGDSSDNKNYILNIDNYTLEEAENQEVDGNQAEDVSESSDSIQESDDSSALEV
tara:strand:- start:1113 stop:1490 length:378 start_codon:yes stop_codon:yes gene_type:complete